MKLALRADVSVVVPPETFGGQATPEKLRELCEERLREKLANMFVGWPCRIEVKAEIVHGGE